MSFIYLYRFQGKMKKNRKPTNKRSIIIIIQIQNMNIKLNMEDINKILSKAHFKCKYFKKWCRKNTFLQNHVSMKLLEVCLSCLHFSLMLSEGEVKSPYFCGEPWMGVFLELHLHYYTKFHLKFLINYKKIRNVLQEHKPLDLSFLLHVHTV
jgi:hypothetical protein